MSVSVFWKPVSKDRNYLKGHSSLVEALEVTFGQLPIQLDKSHREVLRGMSVVAGRDDDNPYLALMEAIKEHEIITVGKAPPCSATALASELRAHADDFNAPGVGRENPLANPDLYRKAADAIDFFANRLRAANDAGAQGAMAVWEDGQCMYVRPEF